MGHDKLRKFRENETFSCLIQPSAEEILDRSDPQSKSLKLIDHPIKGNWNSKVFAKPQPIILELGCGKGEYTIDLALRNPDCNYIGVDIKGARLWKGAKYATEHNLPNVAFLRTRIEFIEAFFEKDEVSEIWLTFSDPQMKSENCRLTSPGFLERYRSFLKPNGIINLKTDSIFLYQYTLAAIKASNLKLLASTSDLYNTPKEDLTTSSEIAENSIDALYEVQTFYEKMFLKQGFKICYLAFTIDHDGAYQKPEFDAKYWREIDPPRHLEF